MSENILKNPGFESGMPNDWQVQNPGIGHAYVYPAEGRLGGSSIIIEYKSGEGDKSASLVQDIIIDATMVYKLSGYIKTENIIGTGASIEIAWKDKEGKYLSTSTIMPSQIGTIMWKLFEGIVTPDPNSARATITLSLKDSSGRVWFDDISLGIVEVPILSHPNMYLNIGEIAVIKANVQAGQEPWKTAYDKLMSTNSDEKYGSMGWAMNLPKKSVTQDGGGHIYKTCNNPPCTPRGDYEAATKVGKAVRNLGLAYALTGENRYADKAIQLINAWCIDPDTYMEPRQGNFNSRIELSITMPGMFYGADLIWNYSGWNIDNKNKFVDWVRKLAKDSESWIQNDCYNNYPCNDSGWCQNQEAWRLLFRTSASVILDDTNMRDDAASKWKKYVDCQISSKGCMKGEIHRATSLNYSVYSINALMQTAEIGRHHGIDLYGYETSDGRGLEKALDFHAKYVSDPSAPSKWKSECSCGKCQQDGGYDGSTNGNAQVYELAYTFVGNKSAYKQCVGRWGRPMNEIRTMGPITLTHGSSFSVVVPVLMSIVISPISASVDINGVQQLTAVCKDQNDNVMKCPNLTWSSSNTSVATVDSTGLVKGVSLGTANIEAKSGSVTSNISKIVVSSIPSGYKLVWEDNFDGTSLDTTKWYMRGTPGEVIVSNSVVKIGPGSGGIETGKSSQPSKFSFKYGYIKIKAKLAGTGNENSYCSQLWLYEEGASNKDEIDITETSSGPISLTGNKGRDKMNTTIHCPDQSHNNGRTKDTNADLSSSYHTYAVEWTPDYVKCFFDGVEWANITPTSTVCIPPNLMYIVLTLCKKWDVSNPNQCWPSTDKATVDAYMYIDYVKVYQKW